MQTKQFGCVVQKSKGISKVFNEMVKCSRENDNSKYVAQKLEIHFNAGLGFVNILIKLIVIWK